MWETRQAQPPTARSAAALTPTSAGPISRQKLTYKLMRSSKSRSRNKSNRQRTLGNVVNRVFDSSGPEGKVRGTPQQIIEKYLTLARDAQLSNDRVAEQSFLQHAEHYTRMLGEAQREQAERQQSQPFQRDDDTRDEGNGNGDSAGPPQGGRHEPREDRRDHRRDERREDRQPHARGQDRAEPRTEGGLPPVISADEATGPVATPESALREPAPVTPPPAEPAIAAEAAPQPVEAAEAAPQPAEAAEAAPQPAETAEADAAPAPRRRTRAATGAAPRSRKKPAEGSDAPAPDKVTGE